MSPEEAIVVLELLIRREEEARNAWQSLETLDPGEQARVGAVFEPRLLALTLAVELLKRSL